MPKSGREILALSQQRLGEERMSYFPSTLRQGEDEAGEVKVGWQEELSFSCHISTLTLSSPPLKVTLACWASYYRNSPFPEEST